MINSISNFKKLWQSRRAFSMIELLAAVVILGVMAVSVMNLYSFGGRMNALIEEDLTVANLLQYKAEEIRCQPFIKNVNVIGQTYPPYLKYVFDVTQTTNYLGNARLKKIQVICRYASLAGVSRTEQLNFVVANYP